MRMQAVFEGTVVAESEDTVVVEGNHYFPADSVRSEHFTPSDTTTVCSWKGTANYFTLEVAGVVNPDAAWTYREPTPAAQEITGRVAFWKGVVVRPAEVG